MKEYYLKLINKEKIMVNEEIYGQWLNNNSRDYLTIKTINGHELNIMRDKILLGIVLNNDSEKIYSDTLLESVKNGETIKDPENAYMNAFIKEKPAKDYEKTKSEWQETYKKIKKMWEKNND